MSAPFTQVDINKGAFGLLGSGTSAADTAQTVSAGPFTQPCRILGAEVVYSAAPTQAGATVTRDSAQGPGFDALLHTGSENARYTYYVPPEPLILAPGDQLDVVAPAAGGVITSSVAIYGLLL